VLVTDDTAVIRRLVTDVLSSCHDIEVVGTAGNGQSALERIAQLKPDVVTLDVEMPVMDGLATVTEIRRRHPFLPVIMFSSLTEAGASATLEALANGANDYVTKPSSPRDRAHALEAVRSSLVPLIRFWGRPRVQVRQDLGRPGDAPSTPARLPRSASPVVAKPVPLPRTETRSALGVVIGVSTGGPDALNRLIPMLPGSLSVPVVVVQHMPPVFTRMLADRLNTQSQLTVREAEDGMRLERGHVYIAQGGHHLLLERHSAGATLALDDSPPENSCRPSVDVTLRSAGELWGSRTLVVMLTGMGQDGLSGTRALRLQGSRVVAQDEATSAVWGMPGAVAKEGLADRVLPLADIAAAIATATEVSMPVAEMGNR
jgi:two-component system chemotaxis response regulator CheB